MNSTVASNTAVTLGGGISIGGAAGAPAVLTNVTISGNAGESGGGLLAFGEVTATNITVVGNSATTSGGGITTAFATGDITINNSLVSGNLLNGAPENCSILDTALFTSAGYNLSDDATCAAFAMETDLTETAAGVEAALADNGGLTQTHALADGSAAIDAADDTTCPTTDQRGFTRQGACDIGAFEFGSTSQR